MTTASLPEALFTAANAAMMLVTEQWKFPLAAAQAVGGGGPQIFKDEEEAELDEFEASLGMGEGDEADEEEPVLH
jgi:hypothetical protein